MKFKVQEFIYDEKFGCSCMTAVSKYGILEVYCAVHPKDRDIMNRWDAFRFCERKIEIKYMQHRVRELRNKYEGMRALNNTIHYNETTKQLNSNGWRDATLNMRIQEDVAKEEWEKAREQYHGMKENYIQWCDLWLDERRRQRELQNKNENNEGH